MAIHPKMAILRVLFMAFSMWQRVAPPSEEESRGQALG
jgi:hypothetical protein